MAEHLERIVNSVPKEVGEKVTKYKLDDPNYLVEDFITPDRKSVKLSVDQFVEKLEIVSQAILKQKKAEKLLNNRVGKLEDSFKEFISLTQFRDEF